MPESFKHAADNVRVPLSEIAGPPEIVKRRVVLTLRGQDTVVLTNTVNRQQVDMLKETVAQAIGLR
jgi:hypothetical protein